MKTVTLSDDRPVDPDDERLVAYLDGELQPGERGELEQRLLEDESLRVRLQHLQQSWDWLEQLPATTPSEKMVETTLELVVSDIVKPERKRKRLPRRWRSLLWFAAACVLLPLLAVALVAWKRAVDYRRQLTDLAIAENVDAYLEADDLNFIRQLTNDSKWTQTIRAAREVGLIPLDSSSMVADVPPDQREERLEELSVDQRASLAARWDLFEQLPPEAKSRVREMHSVVAMQTDAPDLLRTMKSYAAWKETLPPQLTDRIEGTTVPPGEEADAVRQEALQHALDETVERLTEFSGKRLTDETTESIYRVLENIVLMRVVLGDPATSQMVEEFTKNFRNVGELTEEDAESIAYRAAIRYIIRDERRKYGPPPGMSHDFDPPDPLTAEEMEMIELILPEKERAILDEIAGDDPVIRSVCLREWADEAADRNSPWPRRRGDESLRSRYLSIPQEHRDRIDLDDPGKLPHHLSRHRRFRGHQDRSEDDQ